MSCDTRRRWGNAIQHRFRIIGSSLIFDNQLILKDFG